ncbi:MAG: PD-(D/E)XK nuclease family protein [Xanthomonadales bacterium]|nr:PD-(D/E)XK nuclease family protein [Xanthomonadales bacterium]
MSAEEIRRFLKRASVRLQVLEESERRFSRDLAPRFSLFDRFRVNETTLSGCIASLLDPSGTHGQGSLFLDEFLKLLKLERYRATKENQPVRVSTEAVISERRRIDILIDLDGLLIGIENKPWAGYQDAQLADYSDWLQENSKQSNWMLVCFANDSPPVGAIKQDHLQDLEDDAHFRLFSFYELEELFSRTGLLSRALPVRVFAEQISKYIRSHVNGTPDMNELEEIRKLIETDQKNLDAMLAIANAWPQIRKDRLQKFRKDLGRAWEKSQLGNPSAKLHWSPRMESEAGEAWFGFSVADNQTFIPCFDFANPGLKDLYWGVGTIQGTIPSDSMEAAEELFRLLGDVFQSEGNKNRYWAWFMDRAPIDDALRDWRTSSTPWLQMANGELAKRFVDLACQVYEGLGERSELLSGTR